MNSRTVWRKPLTRSDSEKSTAASASLDRRHRLEVSAEDAVEIQRRKPRLFDLPQDGAVIVAAVAGRITVGAVASVEAARRSQSPQRAMAQRLVQIRTGEIDEDVLPSDHIVPERAVPGNPRVRVDDVQPGEALWKPAEVAAVGAGAQVDQHRLAALLAERRHVVELRDRIAMPERMSLDADPPRMAEAPLRLLHRDLRARVQEQPAHEL